MSRSDLPEPEDGAVPTEPADEPTVTEPDASTEPVASAEPVAGRRSILLISAAAVVVLAVIGVAIYLLVSDDSSDEAAARPVPTIGDSGAPDTTTSTTTPPAGTTPSFTQPSSTGASTDVSAAGDPQSVAELAASAISNADVATLTQLSCDPSTAGGEDTFPTGAKVEVVGEPKVSGDTATIDVRLTFDGAEPAVVPMPLTKQGGRWCIL